MPTAIANTDNTTTSSGDNKVNRPSNINSDNITIHARNDRAKPVETDIETPGNLNAKLTSDKCNTVYVEKAEIVLSDGNNINESDARSVDEKTFDIAESSSPEKGKSFLESYYDLETLHFKDMNTTERTALLTFCKEADRSGGFNLIFPRLDYNNNYRKLFEEDRPLNGILKKFMNLKSNSSKNKS